MATKTTIDRLHEHVGQTVTLQGWVYKTRASGKIAFIVVRDGTGLCQCVLERSHCGIVFFFLRFGQEFRIHFCVFVSFSLNSCLEIVLCTINSAHDPQVGMCMYRFGLSSSPEKLGYLRKSISLCLFRKSKVLAISLTFAGKRFLQIVTGCHRNFILSIDLHPSLVHFVVRSFRLILLFCIPYLEL